MAAIGIMDGAFFVGRKEIIDWINGNLDLNIQRIEDTASGAIACELLDIMYPGSVPMHKVNWSANKDFEYIANYKILQTAFAKNSIDKYVDVDRLISGRYMDNLEFMQWFKRFYELKGASRGQYDVIGSRSKGKGGAQYFPASGGPAVSTAPKKTTSSVPTSTRSSRAAKKIIPPASSAAPAAKQPLKSTTSKASVTPELKHPPKIVTAPDSGVENQVEVLKSKVKQLQINEEDHLKTISELKLDCEGAEKERDFYFDKLRSIEMLLQEVTSRGAVNELTDSIFKILYATAEGFDAAPDEDNAVENIDVNMDVEAAVVDDNETY